MDFLGGVFCSSGNDASKDEGVILLVLCVEGVEVVAESLRNFILERRL